jgi:hypothetical protein
MLDASAYFFRENKAYSYYHSDNKYYYKYPKSRQMRRASQVLLSIYFGMLDFFL